MSVSERNDNGSVGALIGIASLVLLGRMAKHHREGKSALETVEVVVSGIVLLSMRDKIKDIL
jgi:hypothetical protein